MIFIGPSVSIIGLNINLEGPVRLQGSLSELVILGKLHEGNGTDVVAGLSNALANGMVMALIVHLSQNIGPAMFEEVKRRLSVEGKHCKPVPG